MSDGGRPGKQTGLRDQMIRQGTCSTIFCAHRVRLVTPPQHQDVKRYSRPFLQPQYCCASPATWLDGAPARSSTPCCWRAARQRHRGMTLERACLALHALTRPPANIASQAPA